MSVAVPQQVAPEATASVLAALAQQGPSADASAEVSQQRPATAGAGSAVVVCGVLPQQLLALVTGRTVMWVSLIAGSPSRMTSTTESVVSMVVGFDESRNRDLHTVSILVKLGVCRNRPPSRSLLSRGTGKSRAARRWRSRASTPPPP
jgi:hypothetical protein